jgi:hypothetical protein
MRKSARLANQKRARKRHGVESYKNCGRVPAGIYSGGVSGRRDVSTGCSWSFIRDRTMLLRPFRELLRYGVLRRVQNPFGSCRARPCPILFPKWVASIGNGSRFPSDTPLAACERMSRAIFLTRSGYSGPSFPTGLLLSPLRFRFLQVWCAHGGRMYFSFDRISV